MVGLAAGVRAKPALAVRVHRFVLGIGGALQAAMGAAATLDEVVVTAQKRAEQVEDVPITVSTFSAEAIAEKGLTNISEIGDFTPNVQMDKTSPFSGSSSVLSAYIRGIGQNDFAFNLEPGVGLYIDGVYHGRTLGAVVDLLDLQRVEILKGPQGTLFGRNTIGGAINIITRPPAATQAYRIEFTTGRFNRRDVRASFDMPLLDRLYTQLSVAAKRRDGYQKRLPFPGAESYQTDVGKFITVERQLSEDNRAGGEDAVHARAKVRFEFSDALAATLTLDSADTDETATPSTLLAVDPGPLGQVYNFCINTPAAVIALTPLAAVCGPRAVVGSALAGVNVDADPGNDRLPLDARYLTGDRDKNYGRGSNFSKVETGGAALLVEWRLSDTLTLKSISAHRDLKARFGIDYTGAPMVVSDTSFYMRQRQFSQELQFIGTAWQERLHWVGGLYYFEESGTLLDTPVFLEGLVQVYGDNRLRNKASALFGHSNFALTDHWGITLGLRYTQEHKTFDGRQRELNMIGIKFGFPAALYPDPNDLTRVYPLGDHHQDFHKTSVRAGTEYRFSDALMVYYAFANGFKSGGWTTRLTLPTPGNIAPTFAPESADTHELGLKTRFWGERAQLSAAIFHTDYDNIQVTVSRGLSPFFENAAHGRIRGAELEAQVLPLPSLLLNASVGYIDAAYTELDAGTAIEKSDRFVNTPRWTTHIGAQYTIDLAARGGALVLAADWSFRSASASNAENQRLTEQAAVNLLAASITYKAPGGGWEMSLSGRNLADERVLVSGFENPDVGTVQGVYSPPREWALALRVQQ